MSRIGNKLINIPENIKIEFVDNLIIVKGPYGNLKQEIFKNFDVILENNNIHIKYINKKEINKYGLLRTLINNMIIGVTKKFSKELQIIGIGYKVKKENNNLIFTLGASQLQYIKIPNIIEVEINDNTQLILKSIDCVKLGNFASKIRFLSAPEPYKGKGIRYKNEYIKLKTGKSKTK